MHQSSQMADGRSENPDAVDFLGRQTVLARLDAAFERSTHGYMLVLGPAGIGKSAILSEWSRRRHEASSRELEREQGVVVIRAVVERGETTAVVAARVIALIRTQYPTLMTERQELSRPGLASVLEMLSTGRLEPRSERLIVTVDGLDAGVDESIEALLPGSLFPGVFVVCARRVWARAFDRISASVIAQVNLSADEWAPSNIELCREIWMRTFMSAHLLAQLRTSGGGNALFTATLADRTALLLRKLELPNDLAGLFEVAWRDVQALPEPSRGHVRTALGLLTVAREGLPLRLLSKLVSWSGQGVGQAAFLQAGNSFIAVSQNEGEAVYSIRHPSIREWLAQEFASDLEDLHKCMAAVVGWPQRAQEFDERYALRHSLYHWGKAGDRNSAVVCGLNIAYLKARLRDDRDTVAAVVADVRRLADPANPGDIISDVADAIQAEAAALRKHPNAASMIIYSALIARSRSDQEIRERCRISEEDLAFRLRIYCGRPSDGNGDKPDARKNSGDVRHRDDGSRGVRMIAVNADGRVVVAMMNDGVVRVWQRTLNIQCPISPKNRKFLSACTLTPDGGSLIVGYRDGLLERYEVHRGTLLWSVKAHEKSINSCAVTADGTIILTASNDQSVGGWRVSDGTCCSRFQGGDVFLTLALFPDDSRLVAGAADGTIDVWRLQTGERELQLKDVGRVQACQVSPDGAYLASASDDRTVRVWGLDSGEVRYVLSGHDEPVVSCVFGGKGRLFTVADDATLRMWDWQRERLLSTLSSTRDYTCVRVAGTHVVVGDIMGAVLWFDVAKSTDDAPAELEAEDGPYEPLRARAAQLRQARKAKILCVSANPKGSERLDLGAECQGIALSLMAVSQSERVEFVPVFGMRWLNLSTFLLKHQPDVLYIAMHGSAQGELLFEGKDSLEDWIEAKQVVKGLTEVLEKRPRVILIGACHSAQLAKTLSPVADFIIGMEGEVPDKKSIEFSLRFFENLGFGMTIRRAFGGAAAFAGLDEGGNKAILVPEVTDRADPLFHLRLVDRDTFDELAR